MKHSIKQQFSIIFIGLMTGTIILCWFINNTFLEDYYLTSKKDVLMEAYEKINNAANDRSITTSEFDLEFERMCVMNNLNILVIGPNGQTIKSSVNDAQNLSRRLLDFFLGTDNSTRDILENNENYILQTATDFRVNTDYIEMWGKLENGDMFILRSALESIRESVNISNRFLGYIGFISVIISAIIISVVTNKITKPILELAGISKRMAHLDFDAKYENKNESSNEITVLGTNINQLSTALEKTISELKTANNELQNDIEKKNEIDEMRKEFLSNVSHELKTPIALIQGYSEGLKESINDDEESKDFYCDVIIDEANKMNQLVKNLMVLNQLEFGYDKVTMERFDITALIQNFIQSAEILLKQSEIKVVYNRDEPVYVWADEFKTEEVFMNYFSNAIHHAEKEKIMEVKIIKKDKTVRISVFNTGKPIPEESLEHLFTKFYKVDKARTREYGGSGVGLSIVKAIMESFNKDYGVENYNNGVAFWFELDYMDEQYSIATKNN